MAQLPPGPDQPPPPPSQPFAPQLQPPPGYAPGQIPYYGQAARPGNGIGTAGGVVGIVAAVLLWVPYIGTILGIIAVALSGVGLSRANRLGGASKGMSITGVVCGLVAIVINLFIIIVFWGPLYHTHATTP
jgi:hypothetical protein